MRQIGFEARHRNDWERFETWLDRHLKRRRARATGDHDGGALRDSEVPQAYRRVCQHLALARDRQYSPELVDRLNRLALRGHHLLYGARTGRGIGRAAAFLLAGFPQLVRQQRTVVVAAALLFFGPFLMLVATLQIYPEFAYYLIEPESLARYEEMYDSTSERLGMRQADDNVGMFGVYVWNNIRIGFQTFAGGLAFGLGSVFFLLLNGALIGAVAGHLTYSGQATPFWSFVSGHSAMELTAIVIAGAAGLRLGAALIAPGLFSRKTALQTAAQPAVRLMYGAAIMFAIAAFIEAFWSPSTNFPPLVKYLAGAALWGVVLIWLGFGGRARAA